MAKVIKAFRERYHDFKLYNIGDDYPEDDAKRVEYLVSQGFLAVEEKLVSDPPSGEDDSEPADGEQTDGGSQDQPAAEDEPEAEPEQKPEKSKRRRKDVTADADPDA